MVQTRKLPIFKLTTISLNPRLAIVFCLICVAAWGSVFAYGQSAGTIPPPTVASQLQAAKRIFIAPIAPRNNEDMAFFRQEMVETIEIWRLYEQVPGSAGADLIFEPSITSSQLRLAVRVTSTGNVLWVFSRPVKKARTSSSWENNFASTIPVLLDDMRQAKGQAGPGPLPQNAPPPVAKAGDADLVLEPSAVGGMLRLSVLDPGTSVALWAFRWDRYFEGTKTKETVHSGATQLMETLRKLDARASGVVSPSPGGGKR